MGILLSGAILFPVIRGFLLSARMETGIIGGPYLYWTVQELLLKLENLFIHKKSAMFAVSLGISFARFWPSSGAGSVIIKENAFTRRF